MKTEKELFMEAWVFLYTAAAKNIGFDVRVMEEPTEEPLVSAEAQKSA